MNNKHQSDLREHDFSGAVLSAADGTVTYTPHRPGHSVLRVVYRDNAGTHLAGLVSAKLHFARLEGWNHLPKAFHLSDTEKITLRNERGALPHAFDEHHERVGLEYAGADNRDEIVARASALYRALLVTGLQLGICIEPIRDTTLQPAITVAYPPIPASHAHVTCIEPVQVEDFLGKLKVNYAHDNRYAGELRNSIELYFQATILTSPSAQFLLLVCALEGLATRQPGKPPELALIARLQDEIRSGHKDLQLDSEARARLSARLGGMAHEGIGAALHRMVDRILKGSHKGLIDRMYKLRSKLAHGGVLDAEIERAATDLSELLCRVYSALLKVPVRKHLSAKSP